MRLPLLTSVLLCTLSGPALAQTERCGAGPPASARPYEGQPAALAGTFDVVLVTTSGEPAAAYSIELTLAVASAEEQAAARQQGLGRVPRRVTHTGAFRRDGHSFQAEADGGVVLLGCVACLDASPVRLYVAAVAEAGFWGVWRDYQTGIGRAVDEEGDPLPDPVGYFCARRV